MNPHCLTKVTLSGQTFHVRADPPEGYSAVAGPFRVPDENALLESAWSLLKLTDSILVDSSTSMHARRVIIYRNANQIDPFKAGDHSLNGGTYGIGIREGFDPKLASSLSPYLHNFVG